MDSNTSGSPPLQFETAVLRVTPSAVNSAQGVACATCQRAIADEYFDVNGQSVCASCREQLAQIAETPRSWALFGKAAVFGLGAAIAGAILYYAVIAITNFEIGIVAIAIGYMVGWTISKATGGRGGRRFQVLALLLTYWAVGLAYTPLLFQQLAKEGAEAGATINLPVATAVLLGFSLVLPVLTVIGSMPGGLISGAIIAFGMHQAWRMTGAPALQISGPYRIAAPLPAP